MNQHSIDRNIAGLVEGCDYIRVHDLYEAARKVLGAAAKITEIPNLRRFDLDTMYFDFDVNRVDVLHLLNTVSFGKTPWVSTFETVIPRYQSTLSCHHGPLPSYETLEKDRKIIRALDATAGPSCKSIIAMSGCNAKIQLEMLSRFPGYKNAIEEKMVVLHPPQSAFVSDYQSKMLPEDDPIHFLFVGGSFFRKGGMPMLRAFQKLKDEGHDLTLTIVSSLAIDDYATKETKADVEVAKRLIDINSKWIRYYRSLPNRAVLDLMKVSHVGLLPTYADTYGFSVLEFQACGCPVISTDVRALPEINGESVGWTIKVSKNVFGEAIYTSQRARIEIAEQISSGIVEIVQKIFRNRADIQAKADSSLERIRAEHAPEIYAQRLRKIYLNAILGR